LHRPVHRPVIGKPIGSRAGFSVDWFEPCNKDIIVAGDAYMFASSQSEQPVADVIDAELAAIDSYWRHFGQTVRARTCDRR
jgi:hypothetical protein